MSLSTIDLNLSPRLYGSPRESTAEVTKEEGMSMAFETVVNNEQLDELASRWQWVNWKKHDKTNLLVGIMIIISLVSYSQIADLVLVVNSGYCRRCLQY